MRKTNSALFSGGMHQHFLRCGLTSFFLAPVTRSHERSTPPPPTPPSCLPTSAESSVHSPPEEDHRPRPAGGPPARHRADGGKGAEQRLDPKRPPTLAPPNAFSPERRWKHWFPEPR